MSIIRLWGMAIVLLCVSASLSPLFPAFDRESWNKRSRYLKVSGVLGFLFGFSGFSGGLFQTQVSLTLMGVLILIAVSTLSGFLLSMLFVWNTWQMLKWLERIRSM
jgi:hypothetical protein